MMRIQNQVILINQQTITSSFLDTVFTQSCQVGGFFITFLKHMNCSQFMVTAKAKTELVPAFCFLKHSVFPQFQVITTGYSLYFDFNVTHECNNSAIQRKHPTPFCHNPSQDSQARMSGRAERAPAFLHTLFIYRCSGE